MWPSRVLTASIDPVDSRVESACDFLHECHPILSKSGILASSANVRIIFLTDQYEMGSLGLRVEQKMYLSLGPRYVDVKFQSRVISSWLPADALYSFDQLPEDHLSFFPSINQIFRRNGLWFQVRSLCLRRRTSPMRSVVVKSRHNSVTLRCQTSPGVLIFLSARDIIFSCSADVRALRAASLF